MRDIIYANAFKKDFKRIKKRNLDLTKLKRIINSIAQDEPLPVQARPHKLIGDYSGFWECHIEADWLLIYSLTDEVLTLYRTGKHTDLFKNY